MCKATEFGFPDADSSWPKLISSRFLQELGRHPVSGKPVEVSVGRYGFYLRTPARGKKYVTISVPKVRPRSMLVNDCVPPA